MACGGFTCSKNSLIALNILYIIIGFILVGVASYGITANYVNSISIIGGIIACGVFLWLIALLGLLGTYKHNQVLLFFYMVILFLLFILQFGIACACLAVTEDQQDKLIRTGWAKSSDKTKADAQRVFGCCGLDSGSQLEYANSTDGNGHPSCADLECCKTSKEKSQCCYMDQAENCTCNPCLDTLRGKITDALKYSGGIGLFFSFTEIFGFILSCRYRNMPSPSHVPLQ
uniref:Tetraspanin n=1 Tax=Strigamia maritima TaxID=126957 RepID=T1IJM5_STRMM